MKKSRQVNSSKPGVASGYGREYPAEKEAPDRPYIAQLEAALRKYQDIVENIEDMVFECDAEGRLTYVSPNIEGILGYKPEEVLGQGPVDFMLPEEREEKFEKGFRVASAAKEKIKAVEIVYLHKDGSRIVLEVNATPFLAADGTLLGFRGVYRDITSRKSMEAGLREAEQRFRNYFETDHAGKAISSIDKEFADVNDKLCSMLGYSREELLGRTWSELTVPRRPGPGC